MNWVVEEDSALLKEDHILLRRPARPEKDKPVGPAFPSSRKIWIFAMAAAGLSIGHPRPTTRCSRVAVNRVWQWHFGEGLQRLRATSACWVAGPQSKLLDYLAANSSRLQHEMAAPVDGDVGHPQNGVTMIRYFAADRKSIPPTPTVARAAETAGAEPLWGPILSSAGGWIWR